MGKRDAQAGDVPFMDGLGHSPVVPHPRQSQPAPSYPVVATTAPGRSAPSPCPDIFHVASGEPSNRTARFLAGGLRDGIQSTA
ncbi:hypothetical protein BKH27_06420 [Actinomyces oris]|uniref:Uncharacterized protein n=1 Tax=Actinomyces oris TaxID=544580 RepID=A0A1Q8VY94_9ACTO|nr:hypothetical protein BKH27_06420 [Actinomyces oris]